MTSFAGQTNSWGISTLSFTDHRVRSATCWHAGRIRAVGLAGGHSPCRWLPCHRAA